MGLYCGIVFGCDPIIHRMSEVRGRRDAVGCPGVFGPVWSCRPSWSRLASSVAGQRLSDISIKQFNDPAWVRVPRARWGVGVSRGAGARHGSREMAPADWPSGRRVSGGALCRQGVGVLRGAHRSVFVGRPGDTEMCGGPNRCDSMATFRRREGIFQAIRR